MQGLKIGLDPVALKQVQASRMTLDGSSPEQAQESVRG